MKRDLGKLDADIESIETLKAIFVPSKEYVALSAAESCVIYGAKGAGKTAFRRALCELDLAPFFATDSVALDSLKFDALMSALKELSAVNKGEIPRLAQLAWSKFLYVKCLQLAAAELRQSSPSLFEEIDTFLRQKDVSTGNSHNLLMRAINWWFQIIDRLAKTPSATPYRFRQLDDVAIDRELQELVAATAGYLRMQRRKMLICLDGLDSITAASSSEARSAVFAGLIDAIFKTMSDAKIKDVFYFKAFLPQELALEAHNILWDADKHFFDFVYLNWSRQELKEFILRRIELSSKRLGEAAWLELFPASVRNPVHNVDEDTFDYLLRHTLYRPRHLLTHVIELIEAWTSVGRIDPTFIPGVVRLTNEKLATLFVSQVRNRFPNIEAFLKSFRGQACSMDPKLMVEKIQRFLADDELSRAEQYFADLYNLGIFGVTERGQAGGTSGIRRFRFCFVGARHFVPLHPNDAAEVAIAPMLKEYCSCAAALGGVIVPDDGSFTS